MAGKDRLAAKQEKKKNEMGQQARIRKRLSGADSGPWGERIDIVSATLLQTVRRVNHAEGPAARSWILARTCSSIHV